MLGRGPLAQISATFRDQAQRQVWTDAVDLRQIEPGQLIQHRAKIKAEVTGLLRSMTWLGQRRGGVGFVGRQRGQDLLDLHIGNLATIRGECAPRTRVFVGPPRVSSVTRVVMNVRASSHARTPRRT